MDIDIESLKSKEKIPDSITLKDYRAASTLLLDAMDYHFGTNGSQKAEIASKNGRRQIEKKITKQNAQDYFGLISETAEELAKKHGLELGTLRDDWKEVLSELGLKEVTPELLRLVEEQDRTIIQMIFHQLKIKAEMKSFLKGLKNCRAEYAQRRLLACKNAKAVPENIDDQVKWADSILELVIKKFDNTFFLSRLRNVVKQNAIARSKKQMKECNAEKIVLMKWESLRRVDVDCLRMLEDMGCSQDEAENFAVSYLGTHYTAYSQRLFVKCVIESIYEEIKKVLIEKLRLDFALLTRVNIIEGRLKMSLESILDDLSLKNLVFLIRNAADIDPSVLEAIFNRSDYTKEIERALDFLEKVKNHPNLLNEKFDENFESIKVFCYEYLMDYKERALAQTIEKLWDSKEALASFPNVLGKFKKTLSRLIYA